MSDGEEVIGRWICVEILEAAEADAMELRALHLVTWEATYRDRASESWYSEGLATHAARDWGELVRAQAARGGGVLIARSGGSVIGLCQYGPTEDPDDNPARVGHIHRLYVHPASQRAGVGRSLLAASVDRLRRRGASAATLWVLETDQRATAFYERLGWNADGSRRDHPPVDLRYRILLR